MPLDLFRRNYVIHLRGSVGENLPRYLVPKSWAGKPPAGMEAKLRSELEPAAPLELEAPDGKETKDFENAVQVHKAFPHLTPLQARDPRLWTRLTHVECWAYMRKRWDVTRVVGDDAKRQRYVLEHYFIQNRQSRALLRNGLARLWWYAHLTHDPRRSDPYELTRVLLSSLDIAKLLLEVNMGRAPHVRTAFLDFLRLNADRLGTSSEQRRTRIRTLAKSLNLRGGVTLLDCLETGDICDLLNHELSSASAVQ